MIDMDDMSRAANKLNGFEGRFNVMADSTTSNDYACGLVKGMEDGFSISAAIIRSFGRVDDKEDFKRLKTRIENTVEWCSPFEDTAGYASGFAEGRAASAEIANSMLDLVFMEWPAATAPESEEK